MPKDASGNLLNLVLQNKFPQIFFGHFSTVVFHFAVGMAHVLAKNI